MHSHALLMNGAFACIGWPRQPGQRRMLCILSAFFTVGASSYNAKWLVRLAPKQSSPYDSSLLWLHASPRLDQWASSVPAGIMPWRAVRRPHAPPMDGKYSHRAGGIHTWSAEAGSGSWPEAVGSGALCSGGRSDIDRILLLRGFPSSPPLPPCHTHKQGIRHAC